MNNLYKMVVVAIAALVVSHANAQGFIDPGTMGMKSLVVDALKDGKAEGTLEGNIASVFQNATSSNEPVLVKITRVKQYDYGCGRIHVEMIQDGVKADDGRKIRVNPAFEISICPSGLPPHEVREEQEQHRRETLKMCKANTTKGEQEKDSSHVNGHISIAGCPSSGHVQMKYTGDCDAIKMPSGQVVNYDLDQKGKLNIQLRMPLQCNSPSLRNQWSLTMIEKDGLLLGDVVTVW